MGHWKRVPTARRMWCLPAGCAVCFLQHAQTVPSLPRFSAHCGHVLPPCDLCQVPWCWVGYHPLGRAGQLPPLQ